MAGIVNDVSELFVKIFGDTTGRMIKKVYSDDAPDELITAAKEILSDVVGSDNAKKQLQPIIEKYAGILNKG